MISTKVMTVNFITSFNGGICSSSCVSYFKRLTVFIALNLIASSSFASKVTAIADGDWNDNTTWDDTHPGCYDSICIPVGIIVTITANEDLEACSAILIFIEGRLEFQTGKRLKLPCGDSGLIIEAGGSVGVGGGGGASTTISICGDEIWNAGMGDLSGPVLLPIELCCFKAELLDRKGHLTWETKSEIDSYGFDVQRSADGVNWETIGFLAGAGSSTATVYYEFYDENPLLGFNYYRLIHSDFDRGQEIFDPILLINGEPDLIKEMFVFPNPLVGDQLTVYVENIVKEKIEFSLYALDGELVMSETVPVFYGEYCIITIPFGLTNGVYFIHIGELTERLVVL